MADVLDQLSTAIGRPVKPLERAQKPAKEPEKITLAHEDAAAKPVAPSLESVIGRKPEAVKMQPLASARWQMYSTARKNGFNSDVAAKTAMSEASIMTADPSNWRKVTSTLGKIPTGTGKTFGDIAGEAGEVLHRAWANPMGISDEQWEKDQKSFNEFIDKQQKAFGPGAASEFTAGAYKGAYKFTGEMLSPGQIALAVGTFGESALIRAGAKLGIPGAEVSAKTLSKLMQVHFAAQMIEGTASGIENTIKSASRGDWQSAGQEAINGLISGVMAKGIVGHEMAESRVRGDLERTAREMHGAPVGGPIAAAVTSRFDQLDAYTQGHVIHQTVKKLPEYQEIAAGAAAKNDTERRKRMQRVTDYHDTAIGQAWEPNIARRTVRNIDRSINRRAVMTAKEQVENAQEAARQHYLRQVVSTLKTATQRNTAVAEAQRQEEEQARKEGREARPQRQEAEREKKAIVLTNAKQVADARTAASATREKADTQRSEPKTGPSRPVDAQVGEDGHVSYRSNYYGEENTFGVAGDMDTLGVYRQTPRGMQYMDQGGFYAEEPENVYLAPDHETADTIGKLSSLRHTAESEGNAQEEKLLAQLEREVVSGDKTAADARKEAGIQEKIELPGEVDALRAGDLKGPLVDKTHADFYREIAEQGKEAGFTPEETEELVKQAGVMARAETENNLHNVARSGDYITSKKGVRWTLDSRGIMHPDDGGTPFPLMKNGHYSSQALNLATSGRIGWSERTREQRRADTARQRSIQAMIDTIKPEISAAIDHVLKVAQQNVGLEITPENLPSETEGGKKERGKGFGPPDAQTAQARQAAIGISALIRDGLEKSGAAEVVDAIAKDNGVDAEEVLRQKLAQDDSPAGKAASLMVGDKIGDPFRKAPWVVEQSKSGGLQLRSGNANPLPLDRLNPSSRVMGLIRSGSLQQERPITEQDVEHVAFESPHVAYRDNLVDEVRAIQNGTQVIPEPQSTSQAKAQAGAARRRTDAAVSKATETQADALEPPPGTTVEQAEAKVDETTQDQKTAEEAYSQETAAEAKVVPKDAFPPRAPISIGLRGNDGVIKQNGRELPMHYEMVPLESLLTSHTWQGNYQVENGEYTAELQPRTISEQESLQNVMRSHPQQTDERGMTTGYDFAEYADKTINGQMGPAIIEPGGRVVGGNTRIGIMRKHLEFLNEIQDPIEREVTLSIFQDQMRQLGREHGMEMPGDDLNYTVVRMLDQPIETLREAADLGRLFNKSISVQMTQSAKGVSYSKALTDENLSTLGRLIEEHDGLPNSIAANPDYFARLVTNNFGIVPSEFADWFEGDTTSGLVLNDNGRRQFTKALLGTVFKDTSVLNRVEGTVPYRAVERALPYIIKMRSIPDRDISAKVIEAVTASADTMDTDAALSNISDKWGATYRPDQVEFLGMEQERPPEPDRIVEALWRAMHGSNVATPRTFNDRLKNWIGEESASNVSMFAVHETPAEVFSRVFAKELRDSGFSHKQKGDQSISQAEFDAMQRNIPGEVESKPEPKKQPAEKAKTKGALTPPPTLEGKRATPEAKISEAKAEKGFVTPDELKTFLSGHDSTKEHVPEIMRTAQMMAEYVFDADPPVGMDRKEALAWVLKERVAKLEIAEKGKGRGSYSDPLIEKGIGTGILKLTNAADETTFIHEFAHVIFPMLSEEDHRAINTILHEKIPQWDHGTPLKGEAYKGLSEKFAGALEKFLRDQNPRGFSAEVKMVLAKVKEMFRQAYMRFRGDPLGNFKLTDEAKQVFTDMFHIEDLDISDSWHDEVKKARAEAKRLTKPEDEPHPVVKIAQEAGAAGLRKSFAGKVEDTVGDRVDQKKNTVVLFYPSADAAMPAWADVGTEKSKIQDAELIAGEDGSYGIRINTPNKVPTDVLYQEVTRKHPGIELEEVKKKLAATPESAPMVRKLLQLKVQNLENEIRAKYGAEERKPTETKEAAKAAIQEKKNAGTSKQTVSDLRRLSERGSGSLGGRDFRALAESTLLGRKDDATVRSAGGPLPGTRSLTGVKPVNLQPIAGRGEPVGILEGQKFDAKEWLDGLEKAGLPRNLPPPTVTISRETAAQLKYAGQKQMVQTILSALDQGDGAVIASATGSGKTYTASGTIKEFLNANPAAKVLYITKNRNLLDGDKKKSFKAVAKGTFGVDVRTVDVEQYVNGNVQQMRKGTPTGSAAVQGVSRGSDAGVPQGNSANSRTTQEDELSQLRPRVPQAGADRQGSVRGAGMPGDISDASPGLRPAAANRMALQDTPPGTSSNTLGVGRGTLSPGVYGTTYQRLLGNDLWKNNDWDLVVADESGEMRNWFRDENQQGKAGMDVIDKSKKAVYVSATPFHSPAEYGYAKKLNLWPKNGFDKWIAENFAHEKLGDKIVAKLDPGKQAKLRQQMIERGQFVSQMISYEGFTTHFGVVPISDEHRIALNRIHEGVSRAKAQLVQAGRKGLADRLSAFEATYTKSYLERSRLPQAIELAKKAMDQGWHPLIFSETTSEDLFRRPEDGEPGTYRKLDQEMGGELSRIIPPFPNIFDELKAVFGDRIADFSGMDNTDAEREEAKRSYLEGSTRGLYTTYAAGGIGVSLHDEDGDKPRFAIYLGPPYSGVLLEQALGRPWRFGVKSNVIAVMLATDSEPDVQLMATKVGPRMKALRATVLGERDSLGTVMGNYTDEQKMREQQDMLAYDQGNEVKVDANSFQRRDKRNVKIDSWSAINVPHADTAKHKGMQIKMAGKDGDWATMYQPKNRFNRPPLTMGEFAAQRKLNETAEAIAKGTGLPPGDPQLTMDPSEREAVAGAAAAVGAQQADIPVDRDKGNASKMAAESMYRPGWRLEDDGVWRKIDGYVERTGNLEPPPGDEDVKTDWGLLKAWSMSSETAVRSIASQAGRPEAGDELVRMNRDYVQMVEKHYADYANEFSRIAVDNKIDFTDDKVMHEVWSVVEGRTVSKDPAINKAAQDLADLNEIVHADLASADVKLRTPTGKPLSYKEISPDRNYMPHKIDWDAKIEDPLTKEVNTLKEIMGKTFSQAKRERMLQQIAGEMGITPAEAADYLNKMKTTPPVFGHIHRARTIDFPIYKQDLTTMMRYYEQAAGAIAREKVFGDDLSKLNAAIGKIPSENGRTTIQDLFQQHFRPQYWSTTYGKIYNRMAALEIFTKMNWSAIKVPFHLANVPLGLGGRPMPLAKAIVDSFIHRKDFKENTAMAGTIIRQVNPLLLMEEGSSSAAHWMLKKEGFEAAYRWGRAIAGSTARVYMEQYALDALKKGGDGAEEARRILKDRMLISDREIDAAAQRGSFSREALGTAQRAFANFTMFSERNPLQMPQYARLDTSRMQGAGTQNFHRAVRMAYLLQSFAVKFHSLIKETVYDEVKRGNYKPLAYLLVTTPILGQLLKGASSAIPSGVHRGIEQGAGAQHKQDSWDKYLDQFKALYGDHPAIAAARIYVDGMAAQTALDMLRMVADPILDMASGAKQKARNEIDYLGKDLLEQQLGPGWSTILVHSVDLITGEAKAMMAPEAKQATDAERAFVRWLEGELPSIKLIQGMETTAKKPSSGRMTSPPF